MPRWDKYRKHEIKKGDLVFFYVIRIERNNKVKMFGTVKKIVHGDTAIIQDKYRGLHNRKINEIYFVKKW